MERSALRVFMLVGVWLHVTERHENQHVHEPLEHEDLHYHDENHQYEHSPDSPGEAHAHRHRHVWLTDAQPHYPDIPSPACALRAGVRSVGRAYEYLPLRA